MPNSKDEGTSDRNWLDRNNLPWILLLSILGLGTGTNVVSVAMRPEVSKEVAAACTERTAAVTAELSALRQDVRDINRTGPDTPARDTVQAFQRVDEHIRDLEIRVRQLEIANGKR